MSLPQSACGLYYTADYTCYVPSLYFNGHDLHLILGPGLTLPQGLFWK